MQQHHLLRDVEFASARSSAAAAGESPKLVEGPKAFGTADITAQFALYASQPMFWLSHHREHEFHRTYSIGGIRVCARCLGTYPTLFALMAVQIAKKAPLTYELDPFIALLLPIPALIDWSIGRFKTLSSSNLIRTVTGVLLGASLARTLYVHFRLPFHLWLDLQLGLCLAVAIPVLALSLRSRKVE